MNISDYEYTDLPIYLFKKGELFEAYNFFGSHKIRQDKWLFRVWAPNAKAVSLVGDFNNWDNNRMRMENINNSGIWQVCVNRNMQYETYKYAIFSQSGKVVNKSDPYAVHFEVRPGNGSKCYEGNYEWGDGEWMSAERDVYNVPMNIYEVHLAGFKHRRDGSVMSYRESAQEIAKYAKDMGYTHIEIMPISEHPLDASWGYQVGGYYAPTSRYGTPDDFKYFVDCMHKNGLSVIMDWVPAHFPRDEFGLYHFDGGPCYESSDPVMSEHKEWGTMVFDFGRGEVQSFLISNALYWLKEYHLDGLRVDAVASMLYLDYGRGGQAWRPNKYGGNQNLDAVAFLQKLNTKVFGEKPNALMIAEESTAWPLVTGKVSDGGLGFNYKWNMGWMNDLLSYVKTDPLWRKGSHGKITFPYMYAYSENFILPISHDEVVHMKGSLLNKNPGDRWNQFSGYRAFMAYMLAHPGKKLLFMGSEIPQYSEFSEAKELDWGVLSDEMHAKAHRCVKDLNHFYLEHPCMWEDDFSWGGCDVISADDADRNVIALERKSKTGENIICITNFSGADYPRYVLGVNEAGYYKQVFSTNDEKYGGWGTTNPRAIRSKKGKANGKENTITLHLPSNSTLYFTTPKKKAEKPVKKAKPAQKAKKQAKPAKRRE